MNNQMREQFEAWLHEDEQKNGCRGLSNLERGQMFDAWQAALAASQTCVAKQELPPLPDGSMACEYVHDAIVFDDADMREYGQQCFRASLSASGQTAAVAVPQWISVKDRLPEDKQPVAFVVDTQGWERFDYLHERVLGGQFTKSDHHFSVPGLGLSASHWMPLPAAPGSPPAPQPSHVSEQDKLDAERYRWLRNMAHPSMPYPRGMVWATDHGGSLIEEGELDQMIDGAIAAIARQPKPE